MDQGAQRCIIIMGIGLMMDSVLCFLFSLAFLRRGSGSDLDSFRMLSWLHTLV